MTNRASFIFGKAVRSVEIVAPMVLAMAGSPVLAGEVVHGPASKQQQSTEEKQRIGKMLRDQIIRCWNVPPGASESGVRVTLTVELNPDGSLKATPAIEMVAGQSNPMANSIAGSAVRAVKMCASQQPFKLPADKYGAWAVNHITFDPKTM